MRSQMSTQVKLDSELHVNFARKMQSGRMLRKLFLLDCENFSDCEIEIYFYDSRMEDGCASASGETPTKIYSTSGCLFCGCKQSDPRKKTRLSGKVSDLRARICDILDIPLSSIDPESFVCNERCYREVKRYEKIREEIKTLHLSLKEKFACRARPKRGLPSDVSISPGVAAPSKSLRNETSQARSKVAKSLTFGRERFILPQRSPVEVPLISATPVILRLPLERTHQSNQECSGNICNVQVRNVKCVII